MDPRARTELLKDESVYLNRIHNINNEDVFNDAVEQLKSHSKLLQLHIICQNGNGNLELNEDRLRRIAGLLRVSAKLKELNFSGRFVPNGMDILADALKGCASLTELNIEADIGEEAEDALLGVLKQASCNCKLEKLKLGGKTAKDKFKSLLAENKQRAKRAREEAKNAAQAKKARKNDAPAAPPVAADAPQSAQQPAQQPVPQAETAPALTQQHETPTRLPRTVTGAVMDGARAACRYLFGSPTGRFLIFVCSPKGKAGLPSAVEEASRVQKIHAASVFGKDDDCTAQQLRDQLQLKPGVRRFLFIGHGDAKTPDKRTTLVFTDAEGRLTTVEPDILKELLGRVSEGKGGPLQLVFLNGCCTSDLAEHVHDAGVPFVVSWSTVVDDKAATLFSEAFFEKLASLDQDQNLTDKDRYEQAFAEAKEQIKMKLKPAASSSDMHVRTQEYRIADPRHGGHKKYCTNEGSKPAGIPELIQQGSPKAKRQNSLT